MTISYREIAWYLLFAGSLAIAGGIFLLLDRPASPYQALKAQLEAAEWMR